MKVNLCSMLLLAVTICLAVVSSTPVGECPDYFDPDQLSFLPHTDCSKFYICSQSGPAEKNCPSGLHWNPNAAVCDWPALAGCDPAAATTTSASVVSTTVVPETSPAPVFTPSTTAAATVTAPQVTTNGPTTEAPTTTASASTEPSSTPQAVSTTNPPATATTPASTGGPHGQCPEEYDSNHVVFLPHADCSKYYVCTLLGPIEADCPSGLHWNQQKDICDWPGAAGCNPSSSSAQPTTTEETSSRDEVGQCPEQYDPSNEVFLPHTSDCSKYYICTWGGLAVSLNCPAGLHWNRDSDQCDWPAQAGCVQRNRDPLFRNQRLIPIPLL
ncbi:probable chitinase 10 [Armigeres subalbatus]|uniref:probable chitinase 10 n=1 Tax=Armigeres subalbatus TaxID=124917 RepID=UPI002ED1925D